MLTNKTPVTKTTSEQQHLKHKKISESLTATVSTWAPDLVEEAALTFLVSGNPLHSKDYWDPKDFVHVGYTFWYFMVSGIKTEKYFKTPIHLK